MYEYFPIGQYIVAAPKICGGRSTFKYTRLEVATILDLIAAFSVMRTWLWQVTSTSGLRPKVLGNLRVVSM
ncbi:DUF433 domain-containing protein [Candidatus Entotheonella palauensis]|uniref:DUF433 domain-containing protein n=1 Tax=Candidatus Entotheonella palauensis TaxID=93172 RepID=UPI0034DEF20D